MKQRIQYIDNLKALAIFTVVVGHVFCFTWNHYHDNVWNHFINAYNMPLFFFLSGLFAKETMRLKQLGRKARLLLVPTVTVGGVYSLLRGDWLQLFVGDSHMGYWFLPSLFFIFAVFCGRCVLASSLNRWLEGRSWKLFAFDVFYLLACMAVCKFAEKCLPSEVSNLFCLHQVGFWSPVFWMGFWTAKYKTNVRKWILAHQEILYAGSFVGFWLVFYFVYYTDIFQHGRTLATYLLGFCSIFWLMVFFRKASVSDGEGTMSKVMSFVGGHTLEIYVLQYFFLPATYRLGSEVVGGVNCLVVSLAEALLTTAMCVVAIKVVEVNKYLRLILFGKQ